MHVFTHAMTSCGALFYYYYIGNTRFPLSLPLVLCVCVSVSVSASHSFSLSFIAWLHGFAAPVFLLLSVFLFPNLALANQSMNE